MGVPCADSNGHPPAGPKKTRKVGLETPLGWHLAPARQANTNLALAGYHHQ